MKKKNEILQNQVVILSKEKEILSSTLISTQKDFDAHKVSYKVKFLLIDEKEISMLKIKISTLEKVLKKCEFDKARLEAMFPKRDSKKTCSCFSYYTCSHSLNTTCPHTSC